MKKTQIHPDTGKPVYFVDKAATTYDEFVKYQMLPSGDWAMKDTLIKSVLSDEQDVFFHPGMTADFYDLNLFVLSMNTNTQVMDELFNRISVYATQYTKDSLHLIIKTGS